MIRWRYKTWHFELKKDGILGGAFLDETELEQSLCRYGRDGWEVVTVLDVQNGLVVLCKQPLPEEYAVELESIPALGEAALTIVAKTSAQSSPVQSQDSVGRPPSLFGEPEGEGEVLLAGPNIDASVKDDDEGDSFTSIKIE